MNPPILSAPVAQSPKLLDVVAQIMARQKYAGPTIDIYRDWIRHFIFFHQQGQCFRHPRELGAAEVGAFLDHLATKEKCSLSKQAAARNALVFLYRDVIRQPLGDIPVARTRTVPDRAQQVFGDMASCPRATPTQKPKLLDQVREVLRGQQYALNTEECYTDWIRRFILFHNKRHPRDMGKAEVESFLTHLAAERDVAISTQRQAMHALLFL
jgi:site-specific recombinase XerD